MTWEAKHFGFTQNLTSKITEFQSPTYFVDEMVSGAFKSFKHEHVFETVNDKALMIDKFHFQSPFGVFGKLANHLFLKRYMMSLLTVRNTFLKQKAEKLSDINKKKHIISQY